MLDPDDKLGLADFVASALMRGTKQRNFQDIYDALESSGASLGFTGGTHSTGFGSKALAEDLDMILELFAEILTEPTFPDAQVERLRAQLLTSLAIRAQDTGDMAALTFDQLVYKDHPYSRPEDGYPETIQAIRQQDLETFHSKHYGPIGLTLAIVGAVDPSDAIGRVERVLGNWSNPHQITSPDLPDLIPLAETAREHVPIPGKSQADIVLGVAGPRRRSPDYLTTALGNNVLGQFGMMGRIGKAVREQAGLAYYASSSLGGGIGPGPWRVMAGVDANNVEKAIDIICQEIDRFVSEPVAEEELSNSQTNFIGRLPLSLESNGGVAGAMLNLERFDLGLDYYRQYRDLVQAVTTEDVLETARRYLHPDRLGVATAGTSIEGNSDV
jgi:zinc protease